MATLKAIRASNETVSALSPTAVFVGATSGIGLGAIEALLKSTTSSKVFIIGRSQSRFASTLTRLKALNPAARLIFIEAQVSLLKEVSRACTFINNDTSTLNYLWLSQGGLIAGHRLTSEGINEDFATKYYSRMLFVHLLLPLLSASQDARIISILSAGQEGPMNVFDLGIRDPKSYTAFWAAQKQGVTLMSLAMHELAIQNRGIAFIHTNPGPVATDVHEKWANSIGGVLAFLIRYVFIPIFHSRLISWTPGEAGEVGLYELTSERFKAEKEHGMGSFWRLDGNGEVEKGGNRVIEMYEEDGTGQKVWGHTLEVFMEVLER